MDRSLLRHRLQHQRLRNNRQRQPDEVPIANRVNDTKCVTETRATIQNARMIGPILTLAVWCACSEQIVKEQYSCL